MAAIRDVTDQDDVVMISDNGVIIRIYAQDITLQSRYGGGVRVMRIPDDGRIVTMACVPHEDASAEKTEENDESTETLPENRQLEEDTSLHQSGEDNFAASDENGDE